jgi:hypothetical protein
MCYCLRRFLRGYGMKKRDHEKYLLISSCEVEMT